MARASSLLLLVIYHLSLLSFAEEEPRSNPRCPSFPCGILGNISFPFSTRRHSECGLLIVDNCTDQYQTIQLNKDGSRFHIRDVKQDNTLILSDTVNPEHFKEQTCGSFKNYRVSSSPFYSFEIPSKVTLLKCLPTFRNLANSYRVCNDSVHSIFIYRQPNDTSSPPAQCSVIQPLVTQTKKSVLLHNMHANEFFLQVNVTIECYKYHSRGGRCLSDSNGKFNCSGAKTGIK